MDALTLSYYTRLILTTNHKKIKGDLGEQLVAAMLNSRGYSASKQVGRKCGDLRVVDLTTAEVLKIEVKTASADKRNKYCFTMKKKDKYGGTDCANSDYVICLAVTRSGACVLFVFPSYEVVTKGITICGNPFEYSGRYSNRRQTHKNLDIRTCVLNPYENVASL